MHFMLFKVVFHSVLCIEIPAMSKKLSLLLQLIPCHVCGFFQDRGNSVSGSKLNVFVIVLVFGAELLEVVAASMFQTFESSCKHIQHFYYY